MNKVLLICILLPTMCQGQWTIHSLPTNSRYTGIYFADSSNGWISGDDGIFHTTNGGDDWILQRSGMSSNLAGINARECWATGIADTLLHTTNGGNEWSVVLLETTLDSIVTLGRICFVDSLHGWVVAGRGTPYPRTWILRTDDQGATWSAALVHLGYDLLCSFADTLTGWVSGRGTGAVFRTLDGGFTWQEISSVYMAATDIQFLTRVIGWICSDSPVIATEVRGSTDGGISWTRGYHRFECSDLTTYVNFADTLRGWVVQFNCFTGLEIVHTSDAGTTWISQFTYFPSFYWRPTRIYFADSSHGWVIGDGDVGLVFRTKTGGVTSAASDVEGMPDDFKLLQNYPNPANPSTRIGFSVPARSYVLMKIYNLLGEEVKTLFHREAEPGPYLVDWDGTDVLGRRVASGVYVYRLSAFGAGTKQFVSSRKMLIIK